MSTVVARALAAGPSSAIYSTGLVPNPDATAPGPSIEHLGDQIGQEPPWDPQLGELFWDGSASTWAIEGCNRAAWAVVQMRPGDQAPNRTVKGVVPHCYPQSAQAAETCALWASTILQARPPATTQQHSADSHSNSADTAASSHSNRNTSGSHSSSSDPHSPLLQWGDCANVVQRALGCPLPRPALSKIMYGDVWDDLWYGPAAAHSQAPLAATRKVAAHQKEKGILAKEGTIEHFHAVGNDWADAEANAARRQLHPGWARAEVRELEQHFHDAKATLLLAMEALPRWPRIGQLERRVQDEHERAARQQRRQQRLDAKKAKATQAALALRTNKASHHWCTWHQTKRCAECLAMATRQIGPCLGLHPLTAIVEQAQSLGHNVWAAAITGTATDAACCPMAVCQRCGGWTFGAQQAKNKLKLLKPCEPPTEVGKSVWRRIADGRHPKTDSCYKRCKVVGLAPWPNKAAATADDDDNESDQQDIDLISLGGDSSASASLQQDPDSLGECRPTPPGRGEKADPANVVAPPATSPANTLGRGDMADPTNIVPSASASASSSPIADTTTYARGQTFRLAAAASGRSDMADPAQGEATEAADVTAVVGEDRHDHVSGDTSFSSSSHLQPMQSIGRLPRTSAMQQTPPPPPSLAVGMAEVDSLVSQQSMRGLPVAVQQQDPPPPPPPNSFVGTGGPKFVRRFSVV